MTKATRVDPAIGIWKLSVDKSSFAVAPAPRSSVMKIEAWEDGLKMDADTLDIQGNKLHPHVAFKLDGHDYPMEGSPLADAVSAKRINERAVENVWKKSGQVTLTFRAVTSVDGRTITLTRTP